MLNTGGVDISAPAMVTLPRDTGAESAASMSATAPPVVCERVVPVAYSIFGQSLGNWAKAAVAALVKLARRDCGIFLKAIMSLRGLKGSEAEEKNSLRAAGWERARVYLIHLISLH